MMNNTGRTYFEAGQSILLYSTSDKSALEEFEILNVVGKGGTAVCYEARRLRDGHKEPGKLKEFYPLEMAEGGSGAVRLHRNEDGQLVADESAAGWFSGLCQEYLETYRMLWRAMENPENEVLKNYIQIGDFFYGTEETSTVYIWTPGISGVELGRYLDELREEPEKQAESKLDNVLRIMIALTNCVRTLHIAGILHLDIKPSNFIIPYNSFSNVNPDHISMFDINTLYASNSEFSTRFAGTEGYRAPEVLRNHADNRSDIYSIGAVLFRAVVISNGVEDGLYRDEYYEKIDVMVKNSRLIASSAANSDYRLVRLISDILKKCLAKNPRKRYEGCSELLADLNAAQEKAAVNREGNRVAEAGESPAGDPGNVIRKLLYEHPLYEALRRHNPVPSEDGQMIPIRVLVVGSGTYGQKFIDLALQAGQMRGYSLYITAVSNTAAADRENYLQFRPDIRRFVNVDGSMEGEEGRAYGTLCFKALPGDGEFSREDTAQALAGNESLVSEIISEAIDKEGSGYDYIFIALRDDRLNQEVAGLFAKTNADWGDEANCPVCYVCEERGSAGESDEEWLHPVFVGAAVTAQDIDPGLEQMAFRTHLSWCSAQNLDITEEYRKFCADSYNHASSLSFALSLKYKLYSIGIIPTEDGDWSEAADRFQREVLDARETDAGAGSIFDTMSWLEHRRWVLSLAAEGWMAPLDEAGNLRLSDCIADGTVKNAAKRTHPCLVFSSVGAPLEGEAYQRDGRAKWEDPQIDPALDELDRMSLQLHQLFRVQAEKQKKDNPLQDGDMERIRELIAGCGERVQRAWRQFHFCLKNILNGVESYTRQYGYYEEAFRETLADVPAEVRRQVEARLAMVSSAFFPVIEANLCRDYKKNDEILVGRIPFILTYRISSSIAMAFEDGRRQNGRNEAVFADVASATVLHPEKITYLYCAGRNFSAKLAAHKLSAVFYYLRERKVRCSVTFVAACTEDMEDKEKNRLEKELAYLKKEGADAKGEISLTDYTLLSCADERDAAKKLSAYLDEHPADLYDGSTQLFDSPLENGRFAECIAAGQIPYFEFDWRNKKFTTHIRCDYLRYIQDDSYLRISDMFALMKAENRSFNLPEFMDDYEVLWEIYTGNYLARNSFEDGVGNWNRLCMALEKYEDDRKPLAVVPVCGQQEMNRHLVFELPAYTFRTVRDVLHKLIGFGAVGAASTLVSYTSESCRLEIDVPASSERAFTELFARHELLLEYYSVCVESDGEAVFVTCNEMSVTKANLDPEGRKNHRFSYMLLQKLEEEHFISRLEKDAENPALVSFVYASPRIKRLLTSAGEILEIYTYYQVLKTGYFDDVATGYEFYWEDGGVKNELDLVLTKGFRSIIVECKAVQRLELNYYHKLHSIAEHFGIGTVKVLIGNTYLHKYGDINETNKMQRSRGSQLNIKTISNREQIENIGETLKNLMEKGSNFV